MRSRTNYIITKEEIYRYSENWLSTALRLDYEGRKCTTSVLFRILLIAAGRMVSVFAAGQGVLQRQGAFVSAACEARRHRSDPAAGTQEEKQKIPADRDAGVVEEEERLLPANDQRRGRNHKAGPTDDQRVRDEQRLPAGENGQETSQEAAVRHQQSSPHVERNSRTLPETFWYRDHVPSDERSATEGCLFLSLKRLVGTENPKLRLEQTRRACANQDLHARSAPATVVRRHCAGVAKCLSLDSFQTRQRQTERRTSVVPGTASLPRNVALDHADRPTSHRGRQNAKHRL